MKINIEGAENEQFRENIANLIMDHLKDNVDYITQIEHLDVDSGPYYEGGYLVYYVNKQNKYQYYDKWNLVAQKITQYTKIEEINNKIISIFNN